MRIVIDIDGTISELKKEGQTYENVGVNAGAVQKINQLKDDGHYIILHSARHMKTCEGDVEKVKEKVGQITIDWLKKHGIQYDEIHFGKPYAQLYIDDLAHTFTGWESIKTDDFNEKKINILIPMAGAGSRFAEAGFEKTKPLIEIFDETMIEWSMKSFDFLKEYAKKNIQYIFIILEEIDNKFNLADKLKNIFGNESIVIKIPTITRGQAETCLAARGYINNLNKLFIYNCDTYSIAPFLETINKDDPDGIISCFKSTDPKYSYAKINQYGYVEETAEKKVISNLATNGMYYFKRGTDFVRSAEEMIQKNNLQNNEFYVVPCYNELLKSGKKIKVIMTSKNWVMGTPEELKYFKENLNK